MIQRLTDPHAIYQRLVKLCIGVAIPVNIYIADKADGGLPRWVVIQRRVVAGRGIQLLLEDQSPGQLRLKAATGSGMLPHQGVEAFPDRIQGTRVYTGEHGWPRSYPDDLVRLACRANAQGQEREQQGALPLRLPSSPWYCATVALEEALPDAVKALPPETHGFHQGAVIVVRRWGQRQWSAWDQADMALIVDEESAKEAFRSRKREGLSPLLADDQQGCEAGFSRALKQGIGNEPLEPGERTL